MALAIFFPLPRWALSAIGVEPVFDRCRQAAPPVARANSGLEGSSPGTAARGDLRIGGGPEAGESRLRKVRRTLAGQSADARRATECGNRPGPAARRLRRFTTARPSVVCDRWVGDPYQQPQRTRHCAIPDTP